MSLLFLFLFLSSTALAEWGWNESPLWRTASVLNSGQHRWSLRAGQQSIDNRYGIEGKSEPLGQSQRRDWTWKEVLSAEKNIENKAALTEYMKDNGISESDVAATSTLNVRRDETIMDFSWAYGMSERWMFGVFLPISHVTTKTNPKILVRPEAARAVQKTQKNFMTRKEADGVIEQRVNDHIANQGYRSIPSTSDKWIWGDLSLMNQYLFYSNPDQKISLQQILRFPTSRNTSLSDFVQSSSDQGQIDLGLSIFFDQNIRAVTITASGGYINQLPGPVRATELNEGRQRIGDVEVMRNLGDLWWFGADTTWRLGKNFQMGGGYRYFWKGKDEYDRPVSVNIPELQGQDLHLVRLGAYYVFNPLDERYAIEKKWAVGIELQTPFAGRNSDQATSGTLDLQTYF